MSYITKTGQDALTAATTEEQTDLLAKFNAGARYFVRILPEAFVEYYAHSVYKVFYTTPCTGDDLYDKAVDILYKDAQALKEAGGSEEEVKAAYARAYALKAKPRNLVAFINLETGLPMVIDLTENQGKEVAAALAKHAAKADKFAFEISKTGKGKDTKVNFDIVVDNDDLPSPIYVQNFEKTAGYKFDLNAFGSVLKVASQEQQIEDLDKFGFDLSRIGIEVSSAPVENDKTDDNLGF